MSTSMPRHHLSSPIAGQTATINVRDYGAVGNGIVDDTAALQAALNVFGRTANRSGVCILPDGVYKISSTLTYEGLPHLGIRIVGDLGATKGPTGTRLLWAGAAGGTMMYVKGMNGSVIENLDFLGTGAGVGLHLDAWNVEEPGAAGSAVNVLNRLGIHGIAGVDSTALLLGHDGTATSQVSELEMYDLLLHGAFNTTSYYGIRTLEAGNTKNFKLTGGLIAGYRYGIDWQNASGVFGVKGTSFGDCTQSDFILGTGNLHVDCCESECHGKFVIGTTGANHGSLVATGCSWQGETEPDDAIINYSGHILLLGNTFFNYRDQHTTNIAYPKVVLSGEPLMSSVVSAAGITSLGNWYRNAPAGSAPFYDGSGNKLLSTSGLYAGANVSVTSLGDYGGIGGNIYKLENWIPRDALGRL